MLVMRCLPQALSPDAAAAAQLRAEQAVPLAYSPLSAAQDSTGLYGSLASAELGLLGGEDGGLRLGASQDRSDGRSEGEGGGKGGQESSSDGEDPAEFLRSRRLEPEPEPEPEAKSDAESEPAPRARKSPAEGRPPPRRATVLEAKRRRDRALLLARRNGL
eukprot:COSAG04_NODE_891_length_9607_cov_13.087085_12_plen_161_part_00